MHLINLRKLNKDEQEKMAVQIWQNVKTKQDSRIEFEQLHSESAHSAYLGVITSKNNQIIIQITADIVLLLHTDDTVSIINDLDIEKDDFCKKLLEY